MKIHCTVKEFAQLVRGCERCACATCALYEICNPQDQSYDDTPYRIEHFISAGTITDDAPEVRKDG